MATDALSYTGINRAYSDYAGSRACEELINLRPATEGTVPVKDFHAVLVNSAHDRMFVHHATDGDHYIVVWKSSVGIAVQELDSDMEPITPLLFTIGPSSMSAEVQQRVVDNLHFASAGNIILFSLCDRQDSKYGNWAFVRKADEDGVVKYMEMSADIPEVDFTVAGEPDTVQVDIRQLTPDASPAEVASEQETALNQIQESYPDLCIGPIIIATALKTGDGSTFWTSNWKIYNPVPDVGTSYPPYIDGDTDWIGPTSDPDRDWDAYFDKYGHAYETWAEGAGTTAFKVTGTRVTLTFPAISGWSEKTSIIQSIEVYASRPVPYLDTDAAYDTFFALLGSSWCLPEKEIKDMDLGGQLMFHQASIPLASLAASSQEVQLSFGGNSQVTEETLDTDAGALRRYGRLLSYNARFHYWDSVAVMDVQMPYFMWPSGTGVTAKVFARYADDDQSQLVYLGETDDYTGSAQVVVASSINVKEVITYWKRSGSSWIVSTYRMTPSTSYNYSICVGGPSVSDSPTTVAELDRIAAGGVVGITNVEPDAINVTEQYNPFVFRVEHSYKAPGNILDIQPQMAGITDTSYGRDPLSVFTERGTYALTQGSANVLYGAFLPVSNNVISSKGGGASLPTDMGVFFLGDGSLWLLVGRRPQLISDALHLGPHKYVRACDGYKRISGVDGDYSPAPAGVTIVPEYDVSDLLSKVTFEEFVRTGGRLSFNRFRMELMVSNRLYPYTYVLSLKYRQWFKIGRCVWQDEQGSNIISTPGSVLGTITVLDLSTEESTSQVLVHMQTRPFSMGYRYIHMHRIVSMVRSRLSGTAGDKLVVGLYGSDDLQNWRLLAYSKRSGNTSSTTDNPPVVTDRPLFISQVRTTSSARSWRYYTVCIGGPVPPDSDFGPVLVDYEPVIRRIG